MHGGFTPAVTPLARLLVRETRHKQAPEPEHPMHAVGSPAAEALVEPVMTTLCFGHHRPMLILWAE
jgi:hypothetical protein